MGLGASLSALHGSLLAVAGPRPRLALRVPRPALAPLGARVAVLSVLAAQLGACTDRPEGAGSEIAVYAASSLTEAFRELGTLFEAEHPGSVARLTFAGSQILRIQIEEGAPADVYASADPRHMAALEDAGLVHAPRVFAHNELVVIVPLDAPVAIARFADLPNATRIVLGTPEVPAGRYARRALAAADSLVRPGFRASVLQHVVSEEPNVRLARSKVELGEADAAIVYATDAASSDRVRTVPIPPGVNVRTDLVIGAVERAGRSELTAAWLELVRSPRGQAVLRRHGFRVE